MYQRCLTCFASIVVFTVLMVPSGEALAEEGSSEVRGAGSIHGEFTMGFLVGWPTGSATTCASSSPT